VPVYSYKAMDLDVRALAGTVIADTPRQARDDLRGRGLTVAEIRPLKTQDTPSFWQRRLGRQGRAEVTAFVRELATLLQAGIPILQAIDVLLKQHRGRFRSAIQTLRDRIASGTSLADAFGEQPTWFDALAVSIVRVGESTGTLEGSLAQLAHFQEKAQRLQSRVTTALIYPAIISLVGVAATLFLMTYVVPQLLSALTEAGRPLPAPTQIVKTFSDLLLGWWWAILAAAIGIGLIAKAALRTTWGRSTFDRLLLALPLIGDLVRKENTSRMAVVMATLLRSGLVFDEAVRITRQTLRSSVFRRALDDYERAVVAGRDVAGPLEASGVFAPMVVQMLAVGQESGELEGMLEQLAQRYDEDVQTAAQRLTALMEPVLIIVLAVTVGFIAFATVLPILEVSHAL